MKTKAENNYKGGSLGYVNAAIFKFLAQGPRIAYIVASDGITELIK